MQGITHPEIAGVFGQEGAPLDDRVAQGPGGKVMSPEQAMDGGAMQSARGDDLGAFEHANDAPDGAPGALALDAQDVLGDLGGDGPATASIDTILGEESVEAAAAIGVIPGLDGASGQVHGGAVGLLLEACGRFLDVAATVAVLQPRTDERTENAESPKGDRFFFVVFHGHVIPGSYGHFWGDF